MTMTLVQTITVGPSGAASIEFTGIPQTGTDLYVVASLRGDNASVSEAVRVLLNSSTSDYSYRRLSGTGSTVASASTTSGTAFQLDSGVNGTSATSNTFSNFSIYIPNYAGSANKSISYDAVNENNATAAGQAIVAGLWANTAAITGVKLDFYGLNLLQYSTASLYMIQKGSGGASVS